MRKENKNYEIAGRKTINKLKINANINYCKIKTAKKCGLKNEMTNN